MKTKKKKGFTLTELIVVIVIIGVLAAVMIPTLTGYITKAQNSKDETLVASLNRTYENTKIMDDIEMHSVYDVKAYLESINMEDIEVANKNNLILFDTVEEKFVLVKKDEQEAAFYVEKKVTDESGNEKTKLVLNNEGELVYHISEYYSINHSFYETEIIQPSTATVLKLNSSKLSSKHDESKCSGKHRSFIVSTNGPDIAKAVKAVMDLPYESDTSSVKSVLDSLSDSSLKSLFYETIVKTLYVSSDKSFYYDNDLKLKTYDNSSYASAGNTQQQLTRAIILPEVEEMDLSSISNLQYSTILLPATCETVENEVSNGLNIEFFGNTDLLKGTDMTVLDYDKACNCLELKELVCVSPYVKNETELRDLLNIYRNQEEYNKKIQEVYEELKLSFENKKIYLLNDITVYTDLTIDEGVTLLIPYDESYKDNIDIEHQFNGFKKKHCLKENGEYDFDSYRQGYYRELTIAEGVKITVKGTITVGGVTGTTSQGVVGQTTGSYGQLTLLSESEINLTSTGTLDVYGYVIGDGKITTAFDGQNGSKIYEPFVIGDYAGGTISAMLSGKLGYTINSNGQSAPFSQYGLNNIQADMDIVYGASLKGHVKIFMSTGYQTNNGVALPLISSESGSFVKMNNGHILMKYSVEDVLKYGVNSFDNIGKTKILIYGDVETGKIDINITVSSLSFSLSSEDFLLPIPFTFSVNFMSGISSIQTDLAFLPGSELYVSSEAQLKLRSDSSLFIIDKLVDNYNNDTFFSLPYYPYLCKNQANFIVDGRFVIKGTFGGIIQTKTTGATVITTPNAKLSGTAKFGCGTSTFVTSSLSYGSNSSLNNYELKAMIANGTSLEELKEGKTYTSNYTYSDETKDNYYSATASDKITCTIVESGADISDYIPGLVVKMGKEWVTSDKTINRSGLTYYGNWSSNDASFNKISFIAASIDTSLTIKPFSAKIKLDDEYVLKDDETDKFYMTFGTIYSYEVDTTYYYKFVGLYKGIEKKWYITVGFKNEWNFETDKVTDDTELYAKFEKCYLVTFYDSDGETVLNETYVDKNCKVASYTPTKSGYKFEGWYSDKDRTEAFKFDSNITKNTSIYAKWTEDTTNN